jgi:hypothetical protein
MADTEGAECYANPFDGCSRIASIVGFWFPACLMRIEFPWWRRWALVRWAALAVATGLGAACAHRGISAGGARSDAAAAAPAAVDSASRPSPEEDGFDARFPALSSIRALRGVRGAVQRGDRAALARMRRILEEDAGAAAARSDDLDGRLIDELDRIDLEHPGAHAEVLEVAAWLGLRRPQAAPLLLRIAGDGRGSDATRAAAADAAKAAFADAGDAPALLARLTMMAAYDPSAAGALRYLPVGDRDVDRAILGAAATLVLAGRTVDWATLLAGRNILTADLIGEFDEALRDAEKLRDPDGARVRVLAAVRDTRALSAARPDDAISREPLRTTVIPLAYRGQSDVVHEAARAALRPPLEDQPAPPRPLDVAVEAVGDGRLPPPEALADLGRRPGGAGRRVAAVAGVAARGRAAGGGADAREGRGGRFVGGPRTRAAAAPRRRPRGSRGRGRADGRRDVGGGRARGRLAGRFTRGQRDAA